MLLQFEMSQIATGRELNNRLKNIRLRQKSISRQNNLNVKRFDFISSKTKSRSQEVSKILIILYLENYFKNIFFNIRCLTVRHDN